MSRRIELELTSSRDDGTWTWRAAGAKQPKGELDGSLLPSGSKVGDVLRADADFDIEGITVIGVLAPKGARREPERIEIIGPKRDEQLVTSTLVGKAGRGGRRDGGDRPDGPGRRENRRDRGNRGERPDRGDRGDSRGGRPRADDAGNRRASRGGATGDRPARRERPARPPRPEPEPRPKAKRLRAGRAHRNEVLASLPEEQKPIAEQVLRGGIPAVRQAVDKQNEQARAAGTPEIKPEGLITIAEQLLPRLRTAEWHDRADAAMADVDEVALQDLRSVVVAADAAARDDTTRELAQQLRDALTRRVEEEHAAWLSEIAETLAGGRTVRALRLSSRPPKAGAPLPPDLSARLAEAASAGLTADTAPDRFATVLDALAYAPVRGVVTAQGIPAEPGDALLGVVRKLATRLPQIAALFGIEAGATPPARGPRRGAKRVPAPPPRPVPDATSTPASESQPESIATPTESDPPPAATSAAAEVAPVEPQIEAPAATTEPDPALDTATTEPIPHSDPVPATAGVEATDTATTEPVPPSDPELATADVEATAAVEPQAATAPAE